MEMYEIKYADMEGFLNTVTIEAENAAEARKRVKDFDDCKEVVKAAALNKEGNRITTMNNKTKKAAAKTRKGNREFVKIKDNVGLEFEVNNGAIWMRNGTYSPSISIDIDKKQTLCGFTRRIYIRDCVCEVFENSNGYAELLIRPADSE